MKKKEKKIQVFLLILGFFLILLTYFYYPYITKEKSLVKKEIEENLPNTIDSENESATTFENLEYQGLYDLDKKFIVKSEKAFINKDDPDLVYMTNMHVILYLKDNRVVNILSDKGRYNKVNYDIFFFKNVRATDDETKIFSDNLDLIGNESSVKIYNNVNISYPPGSNLRADKVEYDFETKDLMISMFDDELIKMKILKWAK